MKIENFFRGLFVGLGCYLSVKVISVVGPGLANINEPLFLLTLLTNSVGYMVVFNKVFDGVSWLIGQRRRKINGL
ncbi:hypothetical protein DU976_21155 [Vibrio navarrensis]|uniref:Uncharacterized protein n=1 Tax=Vibrio navarrensis TaxID=29495 RepID=A0AAI9GB84_9VIBR|nr:hypothetical protein [uncultured Vibrio sp.]EGR2798304.1 hypothetical protein [Vibrio navarrensis]ELN6934566.1 hypothetical protein [Vibrio navarrensis]